jgi:hypothetical protein
MGCNFREIEVGFCFEEVCTDLALPGSSIINNISSYACRIIEIESFGRHTFSSRQEVGRLVPLAEGNANPLYPMRTPSLSALPFPSGNVHSGGCETSFAERLYLLQQPAYDCTLGSLSGNNSKPSSHPPCPVGRNLKCQWAIFMQSEC